MSKHAHDIMDNISAFAIDKTKNYMNKAVDAVKLTQRLGRQHILDNKNNKALELYFYDQLQLNKELSAIYFGKKNGDFIMVLRNKNGFMSRIITNDEKNKRSVKTIFYDKSFKFLSENNKNRDYDPRQRPWYKLAKKNKEAIWTDPYVFFTLKQPGITTAAPFYDKDEKFQGVVGVDIQISELSQFIGSLKLSKNSKVFIIDKSLKIVTFPNIQTVHVDAKTSKTRILKIDEINDDVALTP